MLFLIMLSPKIHPILLLLAILSIASNVCAQKQTAIEQLINAKTSRAKSLIYSNAKESARVADTVIQLSRKHNKPLNEATGWNVKGIIMSFIGTPDSALIYFEKTEQIGLRINDKLTIAKARQNKNLPLSKLGKYDQALQTCLEALKLYQEIDNKASQAGCLADIGNILIRSNKAKQAIAYLQDAIDIAEQINDESLKPNFYNSIAVAYLQTAQYALAKQTYQKALLLAEKFNRTNNQISILMNLGDLVWQSERDGKSSTAYYLKAEKLAIAYGDESKLSAIYQNLGNIESAGGNNQAAMTYAIKARDLAIKTRDLETQERIFNSLASYSSKANDFKQAYQAGQIRDSLYRILFDKRATENMNELQTRYQTEKKQHQIDLLNRQNQIQVLQLTQKNLLLGNNQLLLTKNELQLRNQNLSLAQQYRQLESNKLESKSRSQQLQILNTENKLQKLQLKERNIIIAVAVSVLILLILLGLLLYNRYKLKQQQKQNFLQQQAASAVISAETNERNRIANELHDGLGQLFSAVKLNLSGISEQLSFKDRQSEEVFYKTMDMVDESCKEVRVISHQMAPNVLLKSGLAAAVRDFISKIDDRRLKINLETVGLQQRLGQNIEAVLYRVIQESVNNVIKHSGATSLDIQLSKDEDSINAMIEDNGKGFDTSKLSQSNGIGLKNIKSRVDFLQGNVDFSSTPGQGTLIAIHIPI
ncbi:tetratricopeptide repeat-containing sensor histidine kinase [Pedobacter cryotolerans]|uniref:Oxygen sensor histidine kinase NreB n=1 Tax=Pedobacter cryotolerans TaxID=2571270 RepID=A0A4V5NX31_9SPHI|nr:sensor histidine kinase [Pedobacter cryotolerans]TKB97153.1 tetratricopeptide repeat protein [Pedobacter cryotolerans]